MREERSAGKKEQGKQGKKRGRKGRRKEAQEKITCKIHLLCSSDAEY